MSSLWAASWDFFAMVSEGWVVTVRAGKEGGLGTGAVEVYEGGTAAYIHT